LRLAVYVFWNFVLAFLPNHNEQKKSIPHGRNLQLKFVTK